LAELRVYLLLTMLPAFIATGHAQQAELPQAEYAARRERAFDGVADGMLILGSRHFYKEWDQAAFQQDPNFFYFTGLANLRRSVLVLDGVNRRSFLFLAPAEEPFVRWAVRPTPQSARQLGLDSVIPWDSFPAFITHRLERGRKPAVYLPGQMGHPPPRGIPALGNGGLLWSQALRAQWPSIQIRSADTLLTTLRSIKSPAEIEVLRRVARISAVAVRAALPVIAPGKSQREIEAEVTAACLEAGGEGPSFWPWIMSGENAALPGTLEAESDYRHLNRRLRQGELVRVDVGCDAEHYKGDVGRTVPAAGLFEAGQREAWNLVISAYKTGLAAIRAGVEGPKIMAASVDQVRRLQDSMKTPLGKSVAKYLLQEGSTGWWQLHGVGLEPAEGDAVPPVLKEGMVIVYEPNFTVEGQSFYLEDMLVVTRDGAEVLTGGLPYTAEEIEAAMKR
jgi:Xaa-Pro aminopeptidase